MTLSRATYCTRDDVFSALSILQSPRLNPTIDKAIESATDNVDARLNRTFHPTLATRMFQWPDRSSSAYSYRLWLDSNDLLTLTSLTSGASALDPSTIFLEPQRYGPPYTHIEINLGSRSAFSIGVTQQRAISIVGDWGYTNATQTAGLLSGSITNSATSLTLVNGSLVGIGDLLTIGTERMIVSGRSSVSSGQTLQTPLIASSASTAVTVTDGTAFAENDVVTLDVEQMLVTAILGNTLAVERAVNSSVLAAHTGSTIYSSRKFTVTRGTNGTAASGHNDQDSVYRAVVPAPVRSLTLAEALIDIQKAESGYARVSGSGNNERPLGAVAGLIDLRTQVEAGYRRFARTRAV